MLDANDPNFFQRYPNGATVYDRTGRQLRGVVAYNPKTGEVICWDIGWVTKAWFKVLWAKDRFSDACILRFLPFLSKLPRANVVAGRRHGFWPAPLTIVPNQWLHIWFDKE